jgi:hypothetical protein
MYIYIYACIYIYIYIYIKMYICTDTYVDLQIHKNMCICTNVFVRGTHVFNMCIRFMRTGVDHVYMLCACSDRSCVFTMWYLFIKVLLCIDTYLTVRETLLPQGMCIKAKIA